MKFLDLFKLATRMFKARTSRTLLTILGMSIGIGAILFLVSLGYGLQKTLLERITTSDSLLTLDVSEARAGASGLTKDVIKEIEALPGVDEVSPAFQLNAQGRFEDLSADIIVFGSKPSFMKLGGYKATAGVPINDNEPDGIVVNSSVAQLLGRTPDDLIGKEMSFTFFVPKGEEMEGNLQSNYDLVTIDKNFKIIGIIDGEDNIVYMNSSNLESLEIAKYGQAKVKSRSNDEMMYVRSIILEKGLLVSSLSDTVEQANQVFKIVQIILMLFGIIALIVSAIGMFNTMTIALMERTEEIGIMKSIGASDTSISIMFFMESAIMGFLGGLSGVLIGMFGGLVFNGLVNFVAARMGGEEVDLFYSPLWFVLVIVIFSAVVGFLTGFAPARRASKIDPLDALRYK